MRKNAERKAVTREENGRNRLGEREEEREDGVG